MKKIAKITGIMLTLIITLLCMVIPANAAGESYLTITLKGSYAEVTGCNSSATGIIDIPSTYNGVSVTKIRDNAFNNCTKITQVNVPASVTNVGSYAFENCDSLETVVFAGETCTIDKAAFNNCSSLESIALPSKLTKIPDKMVYGCDALAEIEIPSTVTYIGTEAFGLCSSLAQINIPASVSTIKVNAFIGCRSVEAFNVESGNSVYSSLSGVLYGPYYSQDNEFINEKTLVQYPNAKTQTSYTVSSGTKIISDYAFGDNEYLTKITLPAGLEKIDAYAFYNCQKLADITIPSTVTELGSQSFGRCAALRSITIPSSVEIFESAFYNAGLESVIISNGVSTIGTKSFENCKSLTSVTIPASVTTIDIGAFYGCTALESLRIPATVTTIRRGAFEECNNITLLVDSGSAAYAYAVENSIAYSTAKQIKSIAVQTLPNKTSYNYKDTLDTTGLKLTVNYTDGSSETVSSGYEVSPTKLTKTGSQTITVTYEGFSAKFSVNVSYSLIQWIIVILLLGFLWY